MRLTISKSKNAEQLYITKSIRVSKDKTTSKIFVKLGLYGESPSQARQRQRKGHCLG